MNACRRVQLQEGRGLAGILILVLQEFDLDLESSD